MSPRLHMFRPGTLATASPRTGNSKLGDAATSYAAQISCPSDCVFFDGGGCYAESGVVGKFVTAPLNEAAAAASTATPRDVAIAEARAIDAMPVAPGRPLRLHTVGDCKTDDAARIVAGAAEDYMLNGGGPVWTYTHAWRTVERESWGLVSVLASCETVEDVELAHARGYASSMVVEEFDRDKLYAVGEGRSGASAGSDLDNRVEQPAAESIARAARHAKLLPCPAQTRDRDCSSCRLCFNDRRLHREGITIGFEVHGIPMTQKRARLALRDPQDPRRRMTLEETMRELVDQRPGIGAAECSRILGCDPAYASDMLLFIRGLGDSPSEKRKERKERKAARDRLARGHETQPCGSFTLAAQQKPTGPRRCECGWLREQHRSVLPVEQTLCDGTADSARRDVASDGDGHADRAGLEVSRAGHAAR